MVTHLAEKLTWILASGSPRRKELLENLGICLKIVKPEIDETEHLNEDPARYVRRLSREKANKGMEIWQHMAKRFRGNAILIAADTTVVSNQNKILGKPRTKVEAFKMLKSLAGVDHTVFTGYTIIQFCGQSSQRKSALYIKSRVVKSKVRLRALTPNQIKAYVNTGDPMDKAGAYAAQGLGALLVESIRGSFYNVVGLPVSHLIRDLEPMLGKTPWYFLKSEKITRK